MKIVERRTSERTGDAVWMQFECGAGSRWTSTTEDSSGDVCNFSGCNCGTKVRKVGETDDREANWFGLRVGRQKQLTIRELAEEYVKRGGTILARNSNHYRTAGICHCGTCFCCEVVKAVARAQRKEVAA